MDVKNKELQYIHDEGYTPSFVNYWISVWILQ